MMQFLKIETTTHGCVNMAHTWHCTNNTKGVVDACYKWPKAYVIGASEQTYKFICFKKTPKKDL